MRSRALFVGVVLSCGLVSGGWLVTRGLAGSSRRTAPTGASSRLFEQVFERVSRDFVDTLSDSTLFIRAADGLVSELHDPHSSYLSPELFTTLSERTTGRYAGVGAQIDIRDGWITIVSPLPGSPALEAGIQTGDRISTVDGKPMRGVPIDVAQKALRGAPGSVVHLTIERPGVAAPIDFSLTRREIRVRSVQHASILRDSVGYVDLSIFSQESAPDLERAIDSLKSAGMTVLIFDLRADPGGLLDQGVAVADLFLDANQRIVSMRGRSREGSQVFVDRAPQRWPGLPIAVLVDSNSASAAEIVAGALQDHDRALILGMTTYGKGSAQNVFPLSNGGAVKLTTALWFTPSGRSINRKRPDPNDLRADTTGPRPTYKTDAGRKVLGGGGITPDVILPRTPILPADTSFPRALGDQFPKFRDALTDYALSLKASGTVATPDFAVTPAMRAELLRRMRSRGVTVDSMTYTGASSLVDRVLGYEVARYVFGSEAEFARRMRDDLVITRTLQLISGAPSPRSLIDRAATANR
jgi:carboxyl-terminal processing protease